MSKWCSDFWWWNIPILCNFCLSVIYTSCLLKRTVCTMCVFPLPGKNKECYIEMFQYLLNICTQGKFGTQYYALESRFWICSSWSSKTLLAWCHYQGMSIPFGSSMVQKNTKSWINKWIQRSGISSRTVVENFFRCELLRLRRSWGAFCVWHIFWSSRIWKSYQVYRLRC